MLRTLLRNPPLPPARPFPYRHSQQPFRSSATVPSTPGRHVSLQGKATRSLPDHILARQFHSTPRRQGLPILPLLTGLLKVSTSMEFARTAARIALTFVPVILLKDHKSRKFIKLAEEHKGKPIFEEKRDLLLKRIRHRSLIFKVLIFAPFVLFWSTILASLERTPLTGRWRLIILSPDEEEDIASQLAHGGWYQAVGQILSGDGEEPRLLPPDDWRFVWVRDTLRRLESVVPLLQHEEELRPSWLERGTEEAPFPPPADYPLRPRPRGSQMLRQFCEAATARPVAPEAHTIPGPPYSLIIVDKPDASNAFSYGFGPDGGGGIVVYSGFLDEVLSKVPPDSTVNQPQPQTEETSWWNFLFGIFSPPTPNHPHPVPSPEQTTELSVLLSHELAHLILSHHLETLSSATIVVPGVTSIIADVVRAVLFPVTMLFGPFVNDAVASLGKVGSGDIAKYCEEFCTSPKQEIEADVVSARLLAHAGYDPRYAVSFWENRAETPQTAECSSAKAKKAAYRGGDVENGQLHIAQQMSGSTHPHNELRVSKLREELQRWRKERSKVKEL